MKPIIIKALSIILITVVTGAIVYLLGSFIENDINAANWDVDIQIVCTIIEIIVLFDAFYLSCE